MCAVALHLCCVFRFLWRCVFRGSCPGYVCSSCQCVSPLTHTLPSYQKLVHDLKYRFPDFYLKLFIRTIYKKEVLSDCAE
jgi:hypothetical protein